MYEHRESFKNKNYSMPATQTPGNDTEMRTTDVGIDDDNEEHHGIQIGGFGTYKRENLYVIAGRSHEHL